MAKNVSDILKEATKGILTEDVLKDIESLFETAVNEKVKIHVEKALVEQDEDYSQKLKTLLEAVDSDHVSKLNKIVRTIDRTHAGKLQTIVERYQRLLNGDASKFKKQLVGSVSKYIDLYLSEKIPTATLEEAVKNRRALDILEEVRSKLGVDMALANGTIREAVQDGKKIIDELTEELEKKTAEHQVLTEEFGKVSNEVLLEKKLSDFDPKKKSRLRKILEGKSTQYITENFDYVVGLMDKTEEEHIETLKEEAIKESESTKVDRVEKVVIEESTDNKDEDPTKTDHVPMKTYMSELTKF